MPRRPYLFASLLLTAAACNHEPATSGAAEHTTTNSPSSTTASAPTPEPAPAPAPPPHFLIVENAQHPSARSPDGCVTLELDRQWHSLSYRVGPSPSCPHFEQNVALLHEMVMAFDAYGDLPSVTSFGVSRDYRSFFERLAIAAASAPSWNVHRGKPTTGNDNDFVVALAHDPSTFFPEMVSVLRGTHLRPELRSVEKVLVGPPASTSFADKLAAAGVGANAKVPFDCQLAFHLVPE